VPQATTSSLLLIVHCAKINESDVTNMRLSKRMSGYRSRPISSSTSVLFYDAVIYTVVVIHGGSVWSGIIQSYFEQTEICN